MPSRINSTTELISHKRNRYLGPLKVLKLGVLPPIGTTSPPTLKVAAVLCLTYPEEDADDDIRTVAGGGPADGRRQVPQEEGQPAG